MSHSSEDRNELKLVEEKIEKLYELLDKEKEVLTKREEYELKNFDSLMAKLEAKEKYWQGIIEKRIIYVADYRRSKGYHRKC